MNARYLTFSMTKEQFVNLLLLCGTITVEATNPFTRNPEKVAVSLNGIWNHTKLGNPGEEDGTNHFFDTIVEYKGAYRKAYVGARSSDDGLTYEGSLSFS